MKYLLSILLVLSFSLAFAGGPWSQGKNKGFAEISFSASLFNDLIVKNQFNVYAEYGLSEQITAKAILPYMWVGTKNGIEESGNNLTPNKLSGIGNIVFGLKYEFLKSPFNASVGVDYTTNTFQKDIEQGLRTGYETSTYTPQISIGKGFNKGYVLAEAKYLINDSEYANYINLIGEIGRKIGQKSYLSFYIEHKGVANTGSFNDTDAPSFTSTGFFIDNEKYTTLGPKALIHIKDNFGLSTAVLFNLGNNPNNNETNVKLGVYYDW